MAYSSAALNQDLAYNSYLANYCLFVPEFIQFVCCHSPVCVHDPIQFYPFLGLRVHMWNSNIQILHYRMIKLRDT